MPTLPELQSGFARAILREDASEVATAVQGDGLTAHARVRIYWNHVYSSLTEALEATFPVVCRLVDRRFFGFAADRYIHDHLPAGPCLFEYGGTFPDFLAGFPPCADYPYLADVARLEWAMNVAMHAEDAAPIAPHALGAVAPDDIGRLVFRMDPAASWLASAWPIDRIWQVNQPEGDAGATVDLAAGGARLEIRRRDDVVTMRRLDDASFVFRSGLARGGALEAVTAGAMALDPNFDLTTALRSLLEEALIAGVTIAPQPDPDVEMGDEEGAR
jgi:hypothetical protein